MQEPNPSQHTRLLKIGMRQCRYIISDDPRCAICCGAPTREGSSWCDWHRRLVYVPAPGKGQTRLQAAYASSTGLEEMSLILKRSPDEIVSRLVALKFLPTRNPYDALSAEYLRRSLR